MIVVVGVVLVVGIHVGVVGAFVGISRIPVAVVVIVMGIVGILAVLFCTFFLDIFSLLFLRLLRFSETAISVS